MRAELMKPVRQTSHIHFPVTMGTRQIEDAPGIPIICDQKAWAIMAAVRRPLPKAMQGTVIAAIPERWIALPVGGRTRGTIATTASCVC